MRHIVFVVAASGMLAGGTTALILPPQSQTPAGGGRESKPSAPNALPWDRWQPKTLPSLPNGVTLDLIRQGDSLFHNQGGCIVCHGPNAMGLPDKGSALSLGLHFVPEDAHAIDSLITAGIPEGITRSSIAMPPRGASSNLTPDQTRAIAAYVWAISQVYGEPWPGGHKTHGAETAKASGES